MGKRALGGLNLLFHRREYRGGKADALLEKLKQDVLAQHPDYILFTGDLTSLSLQHEFTKARQFVESLGPREKVILLPGNHDCYTYEAQKVARFETFFADYIGASIERPYEAFPYVKRLGETVAVVALSSAVATPPGVASGKLGEAQLLRTQEMLQRVSQEGRWVVLAVHHPPDRRFQKAGGRLRELEDSKELLRIAAEAKVHMIVHGHEHRGLQHVISDPATGWRCQVFDAGSSTALSLHPERCARYNVYTFDTRAPQLLEVACRLYDVEAGCFKDGVPPLHPNQEAAKVAPW